jgi:2'-5' RNA ligase
MSRYFISITLPSDLQKRVNQILPENRNWKKTDQGQLHLTLRFIGSADAASLTEIEEKLSRINIPEFTLRLNEIGYFPRKGKIRVIWLGAEKSPLLMDLQNRADKAVTEVLNKMNEYSFTPHVTLARMKDRIKKSEVAHLLPEIEESYACKVQTYQLMESRQSKAGVEHLPVRTFPLKTE